MKKVLLTLLGVVVVFGVLVGAGFAGYRYGYMQGASGDGTQFVRGNGFGWNHMPMHDFGFDRGIGPGFQRGFSHGGFDMMGRGGGFWFFSPLRLLIQVAVLGLVVWLVYKLLTGWRLTLVRPNVAPTRVEPVETETKSEE